jgi:hypothetical protein
MKITFNNLNLSAPVVKTGWWYENETDILYYVDETNNSAFEICGSTLTIIVLEDLDFGNLGKVHAGNLIIEW